MCSLWANKERGPSKAADAPAAPPRPGDPPSACRPERQTGEGYARGGRGSQQQKIVLQEKQR